ncbi:MAG: TRAP transporter fused permease subunit [Tissierellia bacterium]|nr:TRAP transporter fused permease subunit [Tissierellia bacterium]
MQEKNNTIETKTYYSKQKKMQNNFSKASNISLILWCGFQIIFNLIPIIDPISFRALHTALLIMFALIFINNESKLNYRFIFSSLSTVPFIYFIIKYPKIVLKGGVLSTFDILIASICILLLLLVAFWNNRNMFYIALIFLLYIIFGKFIPMPLGHNGFSIYRILKHLVWGSQGIFGIGASVSSSYIFLFILFGSFLKHSGFSDLINDISISAFGNSPGAPAKVSILASAFMGMINGSAVANVSTTGTITIPLMKKAGYDKEYACAVEAVASTGGQFCPPIMGAVGFIMAEFLGISYLKVMLAAIIPAFLFYFSLMVAVHLEAQKKNLNNKIYNRQNISSILKDRGHLLLPVIIMIGIIIKGYSPIYAAIFGIIATILSSYLKKETAMTKSTIIEAIIEGSKAAIKVGIPCIMIGIIIGVVSLSSLGLNFGNFILNNAKNLNIFVVGFLVMIMSTILGMGVPGVAAYVIVSAVAVPILIRSGANELSVHMFCLIYACLSNITPPVAISSYMAAGIGGADENLTSLKAVKLGLVGFIIPFFFLKTPQLLIGAVPNISILESSRIIIMAIIGVYALTISISGFLKTKLSYIIRIMLFLIGCLMIESSVITDIIGLIAFILIFIYHIKLKNISNENQKVNYE